MVSIELIEGVVVALVLVAIVALGLFEYLHHSRLRRLKALRDPESAPRLASDRAYNRLALARREADLLDRQGEDVERARQLIGLAERSMQGRDFDRAYQLAQSAHETLVQARRHPQNVRALASTSAEPPGPTVLAGGTLPSSPAAPAPASTAAAAPAVPKNRAEAQFQLRLLEQELGTGGSGGVTASEVGEARTFYQQAQASFQKSDYAEAFRLALRGRRRIGGKVESLGAPSARPRGGPATGPEEPPDAAASAELVASQERCPSCGHPTVAGDTFCRGCGAARTPTTCPQCGAERKATDAFCGRCGERYALAAPSR